MSEELNEFLSAAVGDPALRRWLFELEALTENERLVRISVVARRMLKAGEPARRIQAVQALNDPDVLRAAVKVVRDLI